MNCRLQVVARIFVGYVVLYANKLYSDENEPVILARDTKGAAIRNSVVAQVEPITTGNTQEAEKVVLKVKNPNKWSAETPYRYTLIAELKDHGLKRQPHGNPKKS
mgnify:CR=1 FL=1